MRASDSEAFARQLRALVRAAPKRSREEIARDLARLTAGGIGTFEDLIGVAQTSNTDRALRDTSVWALGRLRPPRWVQVLGKILATDPDPGAVHFAVDALVHGKSSLAIAMMRRALTRGKAPINRAEAAWGLGVVRSRSSVHDLIRTIRRRSEDPVVKSAAAEALGYLRHRFARQPLVALLDDPNPEVRFQAVFGLGTLGDPRALPALDKLQFDQTEVRNWGTIAAAVLQAKQSIEEVRPRRRAGRAKAGEQVVLKGVPPRFIDDLPTSDQLAIQEAIGRMVRLLNYDDLGRAEVEFTDAEGAIHSIFVDPKYLARP